MEPKKVHLLDINLSIKLTQNRNTSQVFLSEK